MYILTIILTMGLLFNAGISLRYNLQQLARIKCQPKTDMTSTNPCPTRPESDFQKTRNYTDDVMVDIKSQELKNENNRVRSTSTHYQSPSAASKKDASAGRSGDYKR
ncbi:hypothetical protein HAV_00556 [Candidatus Hepatincola sp. Av]